MPFAAVPPWVIRRQIMAMSGHRGRRGRGADPREFFFGAGPGFGRRPKAGRGDVRQAILHLLGEGPMHGYQIMQELAERTDGMWRPSPGAIYPTLQQLEDEDLVRADDQAGKKVYSLTDAGRERLESEGGTPPWERFGPVEDEFLDLRDIAFQVGAAVMQVARAGSKVQIARTKEILEDARRQIYGLLAEDDA